MKLGKNYSWIRKKRNIGFRKKTLAWLKVIVWLKNVTAIYDID